MIGPSALNVGGARFLGLTPQAGIERAVRACLCFPAPEGEGDNGGVSYQYFYDSAGRLMQAKFSSGVAEYAYYLNGSRKSLTLPNKVKTEYTFDALMRLDYMEHRDSEEALLASFDYTVGRTGKRAGVSEMIDSATANWTYTYDGLDRLATAARGIDEGTTTTTYTYDVVGNRASMTRGGIETTYVYNPLDQLESETSSGATTNYLYDGNGNLSQKDTGTKVTNYVYDSRGRLRKVYEGEAIQANLTLEYAYDFAGNRFAKAARNGSNDFTRSTFLIDNNNLTGYSQTFLEMDYDTGEVSRRYEYGDDLYCQVDNPSSPTPNPFYFLYDGLGTTRALTDSDESILEEYNYHPFGDGLDNPSEPATNYLFTGEYLDSDLGYYYLRARYYSPGLGRFTGFDPAEDYTNRLHKYAYCGNNPINVNDPSGELCFVLVVGLLLAILLICLPANGPARLLPPDITDYVEDEIKTIDEKTANINSAPITSIFNSPFSVECKKLNYFRYFVKNLKYDSAIEDANLDANVLKNTWTTIDGNLYHSDTLGNILFAVSYTHLTLPTN